MAQAANVVNVNFRLDALVKKYGVGIRGTGTFYECSFYDFFQDGGEGKTHPV